MAEPVFRMLEYLVPSAMALNGNKITYYGLENIPASGGAIIALNHTSYVDWIPASLAAKERKRRLRFMIKAEMQDVKAVNYIIKHIQLIPVDRSMGADAFAVAVQRLKDGELVGVHPEATISRSFELREFKTGAARMAVEAQVPIIPMIVWGAHRIWPKDHPKKLGPQQGPDHRGDRTADCRRAGRPRGDSTPHCARRCTACSTRCRRSIRTPRASTGCRAGWVAARQPRTSPGNSASPSWPNELASGRSTKRQAKKRKKAERADDPGQLMTSHAAGTHRVRRRRHLVRRRRNHQSAHACRGARRGCRRRTLRRWRPAVRHAGSRPVVDGPGIRADGGLRERRRHLRPRNTTGSCRRARCPSTPWPSWPSIATRVIPGAGLAVERIGERAHDTATPQFVSSPGYEHAWLNPDNTEVSIRGPAQRAGDQAADPHRPVPAARTWPRNWPSTSATEGDITYSTNNGLVEIVPRGISKATGAAPRSPRRWGSPRPRCWRSATCPTTCRCCGGPAWAWRWATPIPTSWPPPTR